MTPMGRIAAAGLLLTTVMALGSQASATKPVVKLQIGVKKRVDNCDMKSRNGDVLSMHYTGCVAMSLFYGRGSGWLLVIRGWGLRRGFGAQLPRARICSSFF